MVSGFNQEVLYIISWILNIEAYRKIEAHIFVCLLLHTELTKIIHTFLIRRKFVQYLPE